MPSVHSVNEKSFSQSNGDCDTDLLKHSAHYDSQSISRVRLLLSVSPFTVIHISITHVQARNVYSCDCPAFAEKGSVGAAGERQQPPTASVQHSRHPRTCECSKYFSIFPVFYYFPYFLYLSLTHS